VAKAPGNIADLLSDPADGEEARKQVNKATKREDDKVSRNEVTEATIRQTYHVPPEVHRALKILAAEQGTTVSALAAKAFRELLTRYGKELT
jgi:hypothetical protein